MRKVIGLDLNGWRDHAVRDWSLNEGDREPGGDAPSSKRPLRYLDGGTAAVVVAFVAQGHVGGRRRYCHRSAAAAAGAKSAASKGAGRLPISCGPCSKTPSMFRLGRRVRLLSTQ
jgi:hypothetical protein